MPYYVHDLGLNILQVIIQAMQACSPTCKDPTHYCDNPTCRPPSMPWECQPTLICRPPSAWECQPTVVCRPPSMPDKCVAPTTPPCDAPTDPTCWPPSMPQEKPQVGELATVCQGHSCLGSSRVMVRFQALPSLEELQAELRAAMRETRTHLEQRKARLIDEIGRIERALGDSTE